MKYLKIISISLLVVLAGCSTRTRTSQPSNLNSITEELYKPTGKQVLVAMHRGDWRNAPENSLQAIKNAINMGADIVEIDIQKTKDAQLILMHDKTLDRTSTGKGKIADFTLAEIKELYLKSGIGIETLHKIPTLEEAMLACKGKILVNIDKGYDHFEMAYTILQKTGTLKQTIMKSGSTYEKVARENGEVLKQVLFMPVVSLDKPSAHKIIADYQQQLKPLAYEMVFSKDTSAVINRFNEIKNSGSRIWVNTLWSSLNGGHYDDLAVEGEDIANSWAWVIEKGANIIQTDRPAELLLYLRKQKLHR